MKKMKLSNIDIDTRADASYAKLSRPIHSVIESDDY